MKHILTVLFIAAMFAIAFIAAPALTNPTGFIVAKTDNNKGEELPSFRLYTSAVCENVSGFILCHDELFAKCGDFEYMLPKNEVNGKGIFSEDWEDPRNS